MNLKHDNGNITSGKGKDRSNHLHHAIDAFVVAMTSRFTLQQVSKLANEQEQKRVDVARHRLIEHMPPPWDNFSRDDFAAKINGIIVSHRARRAQPGKRNTQRGQDSTSGKLHDETAYGPVKGRDDLFVYRQSLDSLVPNVFKPDQGGQSPTIVSKDLAEKLNALWEKQGGTASEKKNDFIKQAGQPGVVTRDGVKSVRLHKVIKQPISVSDRTGRPYKSYDSNSNAFMDIFELLDRKGKKGGTWKALTVTTFDANRTDFADWYQSQRPHPAAKRVMRLYINDCLELLVDGKKKLYRIQKMSGQELCMAELHQANCDKRARAKDDAFKWLRSSAGKLKSERNARKVDIDVLGRIRSYTPNR